MAAASLLLLHFLSIIIFFLLPSSIDGFSVDLIHRDSPRSPFYNPLDTLSDRITRAILRSNSRINYVISRMSASPNDLSSKVLPNGGEYLMTVSLGTPPVEILAIADTGSDLIWTQCSPCKSCYRQDAPLFDPSHSSTYGDLSCSSNLCENLPAFGCGDKNTCTYSYEYGDGSFTQGVLANDTFTLASSSGGSSVKLPKIAFGCGHENTGTFTSRGAGLVGLGGGPLSLISQLSSSIDGKFAYCLVPFVREKASSRLDFGESATVSGTGTVYTPIVSNSGSETFFFLNLEKITVLNKSVSLSRAEEGNIIIDSGTTFTYLPSAIYQEFISLMNESFTHLEPVDDPKKRLELCYRMVDDFSVPDLTFEFYGAKVVLKTLNTFVQVDEDLVCAAFIGTNDLAIFGNIAQQNFKIGYDLNGRKLAFKNTDCARPSVEFGV